MKRIFYILGFCIAVLGKGDRNTVVDLHSTARGSLDATRRYVKSLAAASQNRTRTIEALASAICCSVNYLPCNSSFRPLTTRPWWF
jgi:hypothetical protein